MNFCKDCKHYRHKTGPDRHLCAEPSVIHLDPVTGEEMLPDCYLMRSDGACMSSGILFEARPSEDWWEDLDSYGPSA